MFMKQGLLWKDVQRGAEHTQCPQLTMPLRGESGPGRAGQAHTSPCNIPRIYTGGDRASLLLGSSVALGSESGRVRNRDEGALQRGSAGSSDGLTQPL